MEESDALERMKLIVLNSISEELLDDFAIPPTLEASTMMDWLSDSITLRLKQEVYGRQLDTVEAEWPADWWQAFRQRWFPAWALRRWPVKMHTVRLEAKELYPKLALPDHKPVLWLRRFDGSGSGLDDYDATA